MSRAGTGAKGGRSGARVAIVIPAPVLRAATERASTCGLDVGRWAGQVVEAFLAGERCQHGSAPPEAPAAAPAAEAPPDDARNERNVIASDNRS